MREREREGGWGGGGEGERERDWERDRQADRQTQRQRQRHRERQIQRDRERNSPGLTMKKMKKWKKEKKGGVGGGRRKNRKKESGKNEREVRQWKQFDTGDTNSHTNEVFGSPRPWTLTWCRTTGVGSSALQEAVRQWLAMWHHVINYALANRRRGAGGGGGGGRGEWTSNGNEKSIHKTTWLSSLGTCQCNTNQFKLTIWVTDSWFISSLSQDMEILIVFLKIFLFNSHKARTAMAKRGSKRVTTGNRTIRRQRRCARYVDTAVLSLDKPLQPKGHKHGMDNFTAHAQLDSPPC